LFKWQNSLIEARAAWGGFLWSPRLYLPLGEHRRQYAAVLTYAALDRADIFTVVELSEATNLLPQEGLQEAAQALVHALEGAGAQRKEQWDNRIQPYWHGIWPKSRQLTSKSIATQLARLAIAAGDAFPVALSTLRDWLQPLDHAYYVIDLLKESGLCLRFPEEALLFLDAIIEDQPWPSPELSVCLDAIAQFRPEVHQDQRYQHLSEYTRRRG
jgi:hypothetical protein